VGETTGAEVAVAVAVTVTVGGGGATDVGGGATDVGGGATEVGGGATEVGGGSTEVGSEVGSAEVGGGSAEVVPATGLVAVRLGRLLRTLLAVLPHPASRPTTATMAAARVRLFTGCRMLIPPFLPRFSWTGAPPS
jgi:hypothetical protein